MEIESVSVLFNPLLTGKISGCLAEWRSGNNPLQLQLVFIPVDKNGQRLWSQTSGAFVEIKVAMTRSLESCFGLPMTPFVKGGEIGVTFNNISE